MVLYLEGSRANGNLKFSTPQARQRIYKRDGGLLKRGKAIIVVVSCGVWLCGVAEGQEAQALAGAQSQYASESPDPSPEASQPAGAAAVPSADATPAAALTPASFDEKWDHFIQETVAWFTLGAGGFNAAVSQETHSAPLYGRHWRNYPKRFGASVADIVGQNFFGDFLLASAFHEDTRYVRRGPSHRLLPRVAYAISRAVITRTDDGGETFNFANVLGTAMSAGLSNAYYPARSRTLDETAVNWSTSIGASGLVNLMPELWPDFRGWVNRHNPFRQKGNLR